MPPVNEFEIGVVFWAGANPSESLREAVELGVNRGQLALPGDLDLNGAAARWKAAAAETGFTITTVLCAYKGEDYADIPTVQRTVGFVPQNTRAEREVRTREVIDFAAEVGVPGTATHIGFVPQDTLDPDYLAIREMVRRVCDYAARYGQTFALETGQEPAEELLHFLHDVNRENLGINFDPANMILYGTGDPIEALGVLGAHVISVHCKDGDWPDKTVPGALGVEKPLGQGAVGMERYLEALRKIGYKGPLAVERETPDAQQRLIDVKAGIELLKSLLSKRQA